MKGTGSGCPNLRRLLVAFLNSVRRVEQCENIYHVANYGTDVNEFELYKRVIPSRHPPQSSRSRTNRQGAMEREQIDRRGRDTESQLCEGI